MSYSSITPRTVAALPAGDAEFDSASYARRIIRETKIVALATTDSVSGFPYLTMVYAACNRKGQIVFLTSLSAPHSRNMQQDARVSVMCQVDESEERWARKKGPFIPSRLTLSGNACITDRTEDKEDFLRVHKKLTIAVKNGGFAIWKLDPLGIDMMAGPRLASELSIEDLKADEVI